MAEGTALPTVSVVVPTYNRASTIRAMITAVLDGGGVEEIIVVDDGSTDGTWAILEDLSSAAPVHPIRLHNGGAARARQAGVEAARGEVVVLLDDDVVASAGLAQGHAAHHVGSSRLVVVGFMPTTVSTPPAPGSFASIIYAEAYLEHCAAWERDASTILMSLWMGNISMRRTDALRVGMRSGRVDGYHADRDFGLRCSHAGLTALFDRSLRAAHVHRRNRDQFIRDSVDQGRSRHAVFAEHADILGSPDGFYTQGLGRMASRVVALAVRPQVGRPLRSSLAVAVRAATTVRATTLELRGARLLGRVSAQYGYELAQRADAT